MLAAHMGLRQDVKEVLSNSYRLALVQNHLLPVIEKLQDKHLLGPKTELSRLDGSALGILQNCKDVVVTGLSNQGLVALLFRKRGYVFVEQVVELGCCWKLAIVDKGDGGVPVVGHGELRPEARMDGAHGGPHILNGHWPKLYVGH